MKRKFILSAVIICILSLFSLATFAEGLVTLSIKEGDVRDVLKMMGEQSGINIVPDSSVRGQVSLTLTNVSVEDALRTMLKVHGFYYEKVSDNTYIVSQQPLKEPYMVEYSDGLLTLVAQSIDIKRVLNDIAVKSQINIIYEQSVNGMVNANLIEVDLHSALQSITSTNNLLLTRRNNIYSVASIMGGQQGRQMAVSVHEGLVTIDVKNGDLSDLIRTIAEQSGLNIVLFGGNHQLVDLRLSDVPVEEALRMIISGTRYSFTKEGNVYLIGDKSINSPSSALLTRNEVINLKYLQAEKVPAMLPNTFPATNIKVIKELNALAVTGTHEDIEDLKEYLDLIDRKIPQIVVEAIIIEVSRNENSSPLARMGIKAGQQDGGAHTVIFDTVLGKLTYNSITRLNHEFYLHLENLAGEGVVTVKARPKITTLNGHQAKINVGTVQYYKTTTTTGDNQNSQTQYQSINAGITLDVMPWVSSTGEITLDLRPNISNLGGATTDGPPQVSQRQIDTTVRVKSGETIIIGGLIQDVTTDTITKVPVLGNLPLIGNLFQRKTFTQNQNELIIFITPRILDEDNETISEEEIETTIEEMRNRHK